MNKYIKTLLIAFLILAPLVALAATAPVSVLRDTAGFIKPLNNTDYFKIPYIVATSTTDSTFAGKVAIGDTTAHGYGLYVLNSAFIDNLIATYITGTSLISNNNITYSDPGGELNYAPNFYYVSNKVGIGTSTPYAALSVVGQIVGTNISATSTTASSTFAGPVCLAQDCRTTWSDSTGTVFSSTTLAYFTRLGSVPSDAYRVDQFFRALDAAGLTSSLVDGMFWRTTQNNASTSMKTIYGASPTFVATPIVGPDGLTTNGSSQYVTIPVTTTTAGSVAVTFKGAITGQTTNGALWSLQNSTGTGIGAGTSGYSTLMSGGVGSSAYVFTYDGTNAAVTSGILDPVSSSASTIDYANPYEQIDIVTNDNAASPTIKAYVDGKLALNDSSGNYQTTAALNQLVVGARVYNGGGGGAQGFVKGTQTNWFLFSRALTATEASSLTAAMRWLNPKDKNILYVGDSTSAYLSTKPDDAWTYQHSIMRNQANGRIYNQAVNGQNTQYFIDNYDSIIYPYRPGINGVKEADMYIWLGINDINGGANDSTTYTRLKSLWSKARRDGFRIFVGTLMPGTNYTPTTDGYRTALNTSIRSDPSLYDSLFSPDRLLLDPTDSAYYLDGYHLKALGNHIVADAVGLEYSMASTTWSTYFSFASTSQMSVRNILAVGSTTVASGNYMFSVSSSTNNYLNVTTATGNIGISTSSPYSMLSVAGQVVAQNFIATSTTATSSAMIFSVGSTTPASVSMFSVGTSSPLLTVNSNTGFVGVGTSAPLDLFSVRPIIQGSAGEVITLGRMGCSAGYMGLAVGAAGGNSCAGYSFLSDGSDSFFNAPGASGKMYFRVTNATKAVLKSTGEFGIATTTPWKTLSVVGTMAINGLTAAASTADAICLNSTTKEVLVNTGAATCTVSSAKYKHNIQDLNIGMSTINMLRPVSFQQNKDNVAHIGLVAEEVEKIDSRLIFREEDGSPRGVNYEEMTALLVKGMQEQDKRIKALEKEIIILKKKQ